MLTGTRVMDSQGHTGTVTGLTRYVTGHMVIRVRWDDRNSSRITDSLTIIERNEDS